MRPLLKMRAIWPKAIGVAAIEHGYSTRTIAHFAVVGKAVRAVNPPIDPVGEIGRHAVSIFKAEAGV